MGKLLDAMEAARADLIALNQGRVKTDTGLMPLGDILKQAIPKPQRPKFEAAVKAVKPLSRVQNRLLEPCPEHQPNICFQHSVLCQTGLPYRDPGQEVRSWERRQGNVRLRIEAGAVPDPATGEYVDVSLPWGTKPRLILAHLNAEALRQNSPEIDIEGSLSRFVRRIRGFATGREIRMFKHQLASLSSATIRLAMFEGEHARAINTHVITSFDLWLHKDERQRALWPLTLCLS
jgi:Plasmid encoded RepA protein